VTGNVVRHNHATRDIKPPRECPACDRSAYGCPCPRGDVPLGRLHGVAMAPMRDAPLSFDPACPIHPGTTPAHDPAEVPAEVPGTADGGER
jgi:hypothetical protein